jgi:hypothetical protein
MSLSTMNIANLIDINNEILSVKDILKAVNYNVNDIYIDKFWDSIQNDKWIYIDNVMLSWMGYNRNEIKKNKQDYMNLLKENFEEHIEYKILNSKEFVNISKSQTLALDNTEINNHNKVKHLIVLPDCFKESLMLLKTEKSKNIKKYYVEIEKIFRFYLKYQNEYQKLKLKKELLDNIKNTKLEKHLYLIEKFNYKQCVYVIEVTVIKNEIETKLIKIGSTKHIHDRILAMNTAYSCKCILLDIYECTSNYREIEQSILSNKEIKQNLYKEKINNVMPKEIVQLSEIFNYDQLIQIIKDNIKKIVYLNPFQLLEKQKMDLVNRLLDNGYNPNLFENFTINIITKNENSINNINETNLICKNCKNLKNTIKQEITPVSINDIKEKLFKDSQEEFKNIEEEAKKDTNESIQKETQEYSENDKNDIKDESTEETSDNIPFKIKHSRGRKIQKINPNNLDIVVQVYNSMIYLLRSNEGVKFLKSGVQDAIRNNTIYKGFRWCFVEHDEDPMISKAKPTNKEISSRITEPIVKMDNTKNKIIDIYNSQEECFLNNGLTKAKLKDLIKSQELFYNFYFIKISDCNEDILKKYNISNSQFKKYTKSKSIIAINPLTKEEIIFDTITEIPIKLGGTESSINSAIKNKNIYNGYFWKIKE